MAKIVRNIEDVSKITGNDFIIEIEEVEFVGDDGRTKSFKINSIIPISAERCVELDNAVGWDKSNFHLLLCPKEAELR